MKLLKVAVAALVMVAMAVPVIAEDRLSLGGEMRVRSWHTDFDHQDNTQTWADQRLRLGGKIAVAEGVSITFRTDITESNWGNTGGDGQANGFGSGRSGAYQQWDRAHLDLTKGNFHIRAGQQYKAYGKTYALDSQDNGVSVDYKFGDVPVNVFFLVNDDNASDATPATIVDTDPTSITYLENIVNPDAADAKSANSQSDAFLVGAKVSPKFGNIATNFFVGNQTDGSEESVTLIGADVTIPLDALTIVAELDVFTGDSTKKGVDAMGTQFLLDGKFAVSDAMSLGGQFFYAAGDDEDVQYTGIGNRFGGWDPVYDVGTSLSNEQITFGRVFNVAEIARKEIGSLTLTSAGVVGGRLYTSYKANDAMTFGASAGYFVSEEDKIADVEVMALAAGLVYKVMENTSLQLQLQYTDGTLNETNTVLVGQGDEDFDAFRMGSGLFVKF